MVDFDWRHRDFPYSSEGQFDIVPRGIAGFGLGTLCHEAWTRGLRDTMGRCSAPLVNLL